MDYIKRLFIKIKNYILIHNNDFSFLRVGDIVWAKRYNTENEKEKINPGHRESPYVIIGKTIDKTYALQCTSNPHNNIKWKNVLYPLDRLIYNFHKNSYINTTTIYELENVQYIKKIGHLTKYDLNKLKKYLYIVINSNHKYKPNLDLKFLKFKYEIGDIILYNNEKYLIYEFDSKNFLTNKLNKKIKLKNRILINNTYYSFRFEKTEKIKKNSKITLLETLNSSEFKLIKECRQKFFENANDNKKSIASIGSLISYNNNFYYIVDEDKEIFYSYRVYTSQEQTKKMSLLKINRGYFYTNFNFVKIVKEKEYKIRRKATEEEIMYNKKLFDASTLDRKNAKNEVHKGIKHIATRSINDFIPMTIICNKINKKNYLILSKEENTVELVNINDFSDYFYFYLEEDNNPYEYYRMMPEKEFLEYKNKINQFKKLANEISK